MDQKSCLLGAAFFSSARCRLWSAHGCRCLSPSMRDKRRTWASLPRSPSPRHLYSISTPWGPGAPSACMPYVWRGRVPLTSEARLIHPRSFVDSALPVAPSPPAHRSALPIRHIATTGAPGPHLWRVVKGSPSFALDSSTIAVRCGRLELPSTGAAKAAPVLGKSGRKYFSVSRF